MAVLVLAFACVALQPIPPLVGVGARAALAAPVARPAAPAPSGDPAALQATLVRILNAELEDSHAHAVLAELCDGIGNRISGSVQAERAVDWAVGAFERAGVDAVRREPVMVPKWVRGDTEVVEMVAPAEHRLVALALGGSIATPPGGIRAPVMVVESFEELEARADEAKGRIVLFNKRMGPQPDGRVLGYGDVVPQRTRGAVAAAKAGAVASLVRSVGLADYRLPHTGAMNYADDVPKIPHAAITAEDADLITRTLAAGNDVELRIRLSCRDEGMVPSANVVAELRGREKPDEVVVIGGHLDSWDVGQGALDDGSGCAACIEVMRLLAALDLQPRRTIRAVLFMNEENGLAGGRGYADAHADELERHVAAIEMDGGTFTVEGFGVSAGDGGLALLAPVAKVLEPIGAHALRSGGGGADIGPMRPAGVPMLGLNNDMDTYFRYHHTPADTVDKVDPRDLAKCSAAMAVMAYALAEMEETLPRLPPPPARGDAGH